MKKIKILFLSLVIFLSSCDVLKDLNGMANFAKCDFRLNTVDNIRLAGVNVQKVKNLSEINILDIAKITAALANNTLPLSLTLNYDVRNPNKQKAVMNAMAWIFYIDNVEMTRGQMNQRVEVMPNNGIATMPLQLSVDLKKVLTGRSLDAVKNFGLNLAGAGNKPTRITLKVKPTIVVSGISIIYPDYITVSNSFGGK
ncbi:MAG: hypothetical protein WCL51_13105 [Bacteroidota bacterium]